MAEKTVAETFGAGAARLASGVTTSESGLFIPDSALVTSGLATPATATAEGHLAAILVGAQSALTQSSYDTNIDQSLYLAPGFASFTTRGVDNDPYRIDQIVISLAKLDSGSTIDPSAY
ncbi:MULTISPECIES: hypothetical protein [unclassified Nodularia (in: cyanobacteria)]|uniref:hypothetical protein n=1 Tax=unclassified Nodularia (in: cyanobacteria) TaxID=2656917 RepID=UPI00187EFD36|nr:MULTISPECIES: hypothetical protein [unclassified Nodularia (in: cyanobacteria)]MBE9202111.1 hypothetical protein [Nodularia sp. LEGE 06071]MCC2695805.1 hypothetical protein [Nodularia sp. LEGE 04288]